MEQREVAHPYKNLAAPLGLRLALSHETFRLVQAFVYREAGIWLGESKRALLLGRLSKRLHELAIEDMAEYYRLIASEPAERTRFFDLITTNETHFFREARQFDYIDQVLVPEWKNQAENGRRAKRLSIWSAGCSSGEEAYSMLMLLLKHFPESSGWEIRILGTDISSRVLDQAREGRWRIERAKDIPQPLLKKYFLKGSGQQEGWMKAIPELKSMLSFQYLNLNSHDFGRQKYDIIFCRNVLIYFNAESKAPVMRRLLASLVPDGKLFLGHAENLAGVNTGYRSVFPNVYVNSAKTQNAHNGEAQRSELHA